MLSFSDKSSEKSAETPSEKAQKLKDRFRDKYEEFEATSPREHEINLTNSDAASAFTYLAAKEYKLYTADARRPGVSQRDRIIREIVGPIVEREFTQRNLYYLDKKTVVEYTVKNVDKVEKKVHRSTLVGTRRKVLNRVSETLFA
ncbi:hypothetical protein Q8F55_006245 [Vanrija albida]|uniref:Uncharacterized protein n=1 Tax=Vanrija albida TaxID=181172 RepID=A0ABR3PWK6_9TREE